MQKWMQANSRIGEGGSMSDEKNTEPKCSELKDFLNMQGIECNLPRDMPLREMINMALAALAQQKGEKNEF